MFVPDRHVVHVKQAEKGFSVLTADALKENHLITIIIGDKAGLGLEERDRHAIRAHARISRGGEPLFCSEVLVPQAGVVGLFS